MIDQQQQINPGEWLLLGVALLGLVICVVYLVASSSGDRRELEQEPDRLLVFQCQHCGNFHTIQMKGDLRNG